MDPTLGGAGRPDRCQKASGGPGGGPWIRPGGRGAWPDPQKSHLQWRRVGRGPDGAKRNQNVTKTRPQKISGPRRDPFARPENFAVPDATRLRDPKNSLSPTRPVCATRKIRGPRRDPGARPENSAVPDATRLRDPKNQRSPTRPRRATRYPPSRRRPFASGTGGGWPDLTLHEGGPGRIPRRASSSGGGRAVDPAPAGGGGLAGSYEKASSGAGGRAGDPTLGGGRAGRIATKKPAVVQGAGRGSDPAGGEPGRILRRASSSGGGRAVDPAPAGGGRAGRIPRKSQLLGRGGWPWIRPGRRAGRPDPSRCYSTLPSPPLHHPLIGLCSPL